MLPAPALAKLFPLERAVHKARSRVNHVVDCACNDSRVCVRWLLQATPAEYKVLRKVCANTAPPGVQMLSAFGIKF